MSQSTRKTETEATRQRVILRRLDRRYPEAGCPLIHRNRFQLLLAVVLSARTTDASVNAVLPELFRRYPSPRALAAAQPAAIERVIRSIGLFRAKARHLVGIARAAATPGIEWTMPGLTRLPGVGRKTANVVLFNALGRSEGVAVDTHCARLARRLGLTRHADPARIERDLMAAFPRRAWGRLTHLLIAHGRALCRARRPRCGECPLAPHCPSAGVTA